MHHEISRFFDFKMTAVRHFDGFFKLKFVTSAQFRDAFCVLLPNVMEIGHNVAGIS